MYNISRKNTLGIHLQKFAKEFKDDYNFFPITWIYPSDYHEIVEYSKRKYEKSGLSEEPACMFIVKPEAGC